MDQPRGALDLRCSWPQLREVVFSSTNLWSAMRDTSDDVSAACPSGSFAERISAILSSCFFSLSPVLTRIVVVSFSEVFAMTCSVCKPNVLQTRYVGNRKNHLQHVKLCGTSKLQREGTLYEQAEEIESPARPM